VNQQQASPPVAGPGAGVGQSGKTRRIRQRGVALLEFALVAPLLFLLLMAVMDLSMMMWVNLSMQHAVREGGRYALTGRSDMDTTGSRTGQVLKRIRQGSMGFYDRLKPALTITINGVPSSYNFGSTGSGTMFGKSGELVLLRLDCTWPLLTPMMRPFFNGNEYKFSVATSFRNE
jgi:hypothetical protein